MASKTARKSKRAPMLIALRARTNNVRDEELRSQLNRVAQAGDFTEAQLIRDALCSHLAQIEERLRSDPATLARLNAIIEANSK